MPKALIGAILIAITLFLGVIFLWPNYQKYQNLRTEIKYKEIEIGNEAKYYEKLKSLSESLANQKDEVEKLNSALPSGPAMVPDLFKFLQKTSSENGLVVKEISTSLAKKAVDNPAISDILLKIKLYGSYSSFKNFLQALENSSRLIEVETISFSSPKKEDESQLFTFDVGIKAHSY